MDRAEITAKLAAAFGSHKAWISGRELAPDGNDAEQTCMTTFPAADGMLAIRALTYGDIADALTKAGED